MRERRVIGQGVIDAALYYVVPPLSLSLFTPSPSHPLSLFPDSAYPLFS